MRVVSVLPSATEIVCALGARDELVGRSLECDYPPSVRSLPAVMRPRTFDASCPSDEIDARVRRARAAGESLYELDVPLLRKLRPEVLLTQDLCGVCSVTGDEVAEACREAGVSPTVVSLSPRTLDEVWESVERVGAAIRKPEPGRQLAQELRRRSAPGPRVGRLRTAVVEWLDPPILAGLWTPAILAAGGADGIGPEPGATGQRTTWPELGKEHPDLVILSPCSFSVERTREELSRPSLGRAVRAALPDSRIVLADEAYFSRPGPRLADGIELVRRLAASGAGPWPMPVESWIPSTPPVAAGPAS